MKPLTAAQSRALAILLLALVLFMLLRLVLVPVWSSWREQGDRIRSLENRLEVYDRLVNDMERDREHLAQLRASLPASDWYLPEATPALAAANLQQLLHRQVGQGGGQVISTQILSRTEESPLRAVSIQVHLRGELSDLVELLYTLESGKPALFVDGLTVLANPRRQVSSRRPQVNERIRAIPALDIRFDLTGYSAAEEI